MDPNYSNGYALRAWVLQLEGKYDESVPTPLRQSKRAPDSSWAYELLQDAYIKPTDGAGKTREYKEQKGETGDRDIRSAGTPVPGRDLARDGSRL